MTINSSSDRRTFIKRAALLGGTALFLALGRPSAAGSAATSAPKPKAPDPGYRLTEHVRKYYETARQ